MTRLNKKALLGNGCEVQFLAIQARSYGRTDANRHTPAHTNHPNTNANRKTYTTTPANAFVFSKQIDARSHMNTYANRKTHAHTRTPTNFITTSVYRSLDEG